MTSAHVARVRAAVEATLERSTARLEMRIDGTFLGAPAAYKASGVVDFAHERHLTGQGEELRLAASNQIYRPLPDGRWEGRPERVAEAPMLNGPIRLLHVLRGVLAADAGQREWIGDAEAAYFACRVDLLDSDTRSRAGVRVPSEFVVRELRNLPGHVWIGDDGLVRRVRSPISTGVHEFDFWDFDVPEPIELPPPHLLVDPDQQAAQELDELNEA